MIASYYCCKLKAQVAISVFGFIGDDCFAFRLFWLEIHKMDHYFQIKSFVFEVLKYASLSFFRWFLPSDLNSAGLGIFEHVDYRVMCISLFLICFSWYFPKSFLLNFLDYNRSIKQTINKGYKITKPAEDHLLIRLEVYIGVYVEVSECHLIEKWEKIKKPLELAFKLVLFWY